MKIKAIIDQPDGTRELTAQLTPDQHRFLLEYAISDILSKGVMIPHVQNDVVTIVELEDAYSENTSNPRYSA